MKLFSWAMHSVLQLIRSNSFDESDQTVESFVASVVASGLSNNDTAELATALAHSGSQISLGVPVTDVPSTGGPASLSTLAVPLLVALGGVQILKVSVPGKPAGALDTLEIIPTYQSELSKEQIVELAKHSKYVHVRAGKHVAPADAKLFRIRQRLKAVICPELVIASLLSKKLCISCDAFVLDVRVGSNGNIAADAEGGIRFAKRFIEVANLLGLRSRCFVTDMRDRLQSPYIGRGESLRGLSHFLTGAFRGESARLLLRMAEQTILLRETDKRAVSVHEQIGPHSISRLASMLQPHGVHAGALENRLRELANFAELPVIARSGGFIETIDLRRLKDVTLKMYDLIPRHDSLPIWEVGIYWTAGHHVEAGQELCKIRVHEQFRRELSVAVQSLESELNASVRLSASETDAKPLLLAVVDEMLQIVS